MKSEINDFVILSETTIKYKGVDIYGETFRIPVEKKVYDKEDGEWWHEEIPVCRCYNCGAQKRYDDDVYLIGKTVWCEDCFLRKFRVDALTAAARMLSLGENPLDVEEE